MSFDHITNDAVRLLQDAVLADTATLKAASARSIGLKSVQRGVISILGTKKTATATVSAVNVNKARLTILGFTSALGDSAGVRAAAYLTLDSATTITATRDVSHTSETQTTSVSWELAEYY